MRALIQSPANQNMAVVAHIHDFSHAGRQRRVRTVTAGARGRREVGILEHCNSMRAGAVVMELVGWQPVPAHELRVFVTVCTRSRDISRMDVAASIIRWEYQMSIVTVGARWSIVVAASQQQLAVPAGPELRQLPRFQPILAHLTGVRVA
jgi:hypothetical protein